MERRQQLIAWQKQVDARKGAKEADMGVAKRLLKHGIESADEIARLRDENAKLRALSESQAREARFRAGYVRVRDSNDSQMRDGDMAREIAAEMLDISQDDSALREMIAAERESCAAFVERDCANAQLADPAELKHVADAIRARGVK